MTACIVGWAHSKFGKHEGRDIESLIVEVTTGALADAGVAPKDVDEIFVGPFGNFKVAALDDLVGKPAKEG